MQLLGDKFIINITFKVLLKSFLLKILHLKWIGTLQWVLFDLFNIRDRD